MFTIRHRRAGYNDFKNNTRLELPNRGVRMTAEIIQIAEFRARRGQNSEAQEPAVFAGYPEQPPRFHFWTGASGKRYVHTVYSLFDCPTLEDANYILVRRTDRSVRAVLAIGRLANNCPSENLAEIRQHAAALGADEVHVHLLASSHVEAEEVEADLISAQFIYQPHSA
jgi:hypothetical protein